MDSITGISSLFKSYEKLSGFSTISYISLLSTDVREQPLLYEKKTDNFTPVELSANDLVNEITKAASTTLSKKDEESSTYIFVTKIELKSIYLLIFQSKEEFKDDIKSFAAFIHENIIASHEACHSSTNERFKDELNKLREFQARLFPKFDNVTELDIASVYLPADLMSGNFIDAFFIHDNVYQIAICSVEGYDASSAFTAATIRTLIRTSSSIRMVPSALLQLIIKKIDKIINGLHSLINVSLLQINVQSGQCKISSLGPPNILHAAPGSKKILLTNTFPVGKELSKRKDLRDITMKIDQEDVLLYYSGGITKAINPQSREQYSVNKLAKALWDNVKEEAVFITHGLSDAIYSFTEYATFEEDIVLLAIKRLAQTTPEAGTE